MKKIVARLKNDQNVIVFDNAETDTLKDLYKTPNVKLAIPLEVDARPLTEDEWYFLVLTEEEKEQMLGGYVSESSVGMLSTIVPDQYTEAKVIYLVSGEEKFFTKVTSRQVLQSQKYVAFVNEKPALVQQGNSLLLTGQVDAYWNGTMLYFKKFTVIRSIFPGIQKMYKEITEAETNEFLSSALFDLREEMSSDVVGLQNRKKIASIVTAKTIDLKDMEVCTKYVEYAKEYNLDLEIEDGKIALIDNADIGKVINLFSESFYTTDITGEKREIRTSRKLVHGKRKRAK